MVDFAVSFFVITILMSVAESAIILSGTYYRFEFVASFLFIVSETDLTELVVAVLTL